MELLYRALGLCEEIEAKQAQLRDILNQLRETYAIDAQTVTSEPEDHEKSHDNELSGLSGSDISTSNAAFDSDNSPEENIEEPTDVSVSPSTSQTAPKPSFDLFKSFTINDRFLFRRELFANNDAELVTAIDRLSSMNSQAEADEYLSTMTWDPTSDTVVYFKEKISKYFSKH